MDIENSIWQKIRGYILNQALNTEHRVIKLFRNRGFSCTNHYYTDFDYKSQEYKIRQLDFIALKGFIDNEQDPKGFMLNIMGDVKFPLNFSKYYLVGGNSIFF